MPQKETKEKRDLIKNSFPSFGKKGITKVKRLLDSEYQKYLIKCLKTGEKAFVFEKWLEKLGKNK